MTYDSDLKRRDVLAMAALAPLSPTAFAAPEAPGIRPYRLDIPADQLHRMQRRLEDTHLPRTAVGAGWQYGVDADWFASLMAYWRDDFDWDAQQRAINRLPQFAVDVRGKRMHFVHVRSPNPNARPLLLLHGWPYSFWSFSEVIAPLARDFHVVVPSLPGSVLSEAIADSPRGLRAISGHIHELMTAVLGYDSFLVQGGDHGAVIADWLALDRPVSIAGEQTNLVALRHKGAEYGQGTTGLDHPTSAETRFVAAEKETFEKESAYFRLQNTRPETISYAMADSPVGTAAYLLDKWQKWTDTRSRSLEQVYGRDRLLTEVMLYVATDSFATSMWSYAGFALEPFSIPEGRTIDVPYGFSGYPDPLNSPPPRELVAHSRTKIVQWEVADTGGHFPFLEQPARFVASLRRFASASTGARRSLGR